LPPRVSDGAWIAEFLGKGSQAATILPLKVRRAIVLRHLLGRLAPGAQVLPSLTGPPLTPGLRPSPVALAAIHSPLTPQPQSFQIDESAMTTWLFFFPTDG
jgi:hypothetical protein